MQAPEHAPVVLDYTDCAGHSQRLELEWQVVVLNAPLFENAADVEWSCEGNLLIRTVQTSAGVFGIIRVPSFYENPTTFLQSFVRCLGTLHRRDGLLYRLTRM